MALDLGDVVAAAKAGDQEAFAQLVRATQADTYTLAYRLTGNEEDARDVVQEAYIRAYKGLRRFRGDAQFSTWLHRITANCAITALGNRTKHRHDELDDDSPLTDERPHHDPQLRAEASLEQDRVSAAVATLPPRLRAVVVLRDIYDMPHQDIATELGISEAAAKVRLHRARKKLREQLFPMRAEMGRVEEDAHAI
jgi:RNA polymerase sigma-70 factor (ECF subfamily)